MRKVEPEEIVLAVKNLAIEVSVDLSPDVEGALHGALEMERDELGRYALEQIVENIAVARRERLPLCQDTGYFNVFVECGPDVVLPGRFQQFVNYAIAQATREAYLRASVVEEPLYFRKNTGNNTPVLLHFNPSDEEGLLRIAVLAKGGGSENAAALKMLLPTCGPDEVKRAVLEVVREKAPSACPPVVVGIGLGGSADAALLSGKMALLRRVGEPAKDKRYAQLERELLQEINALGIGAGGLGGDHTALAVHIEPLPSHMANLALGVVISCHALRRKTREL